MELDCGNKWLTAFADHPSRLLLSRLRPLSGLVPVTSFVFAWCRPNSFMRPQACRHRQSLNALQRQSLFRFYLHSSQPNGTTPYQHDIFHGTQIPFYGRPKWGDSTDAVRGLMQTALQVSTAPYLEATKHSAYALLLLDSRSLNLCACHPR